MNVADLAAGLAAHDEERVVRRCLDHHDAIVGDDYAAALARALATEAAR